MCGESIPSLERTATGTVVNGKIVLEGVPLSEGAKVTVVTRGADEAFTIDTITVAVVWLTPMSCISGCAAVHWRAMVGVTDRHIGASP